MWKLAVGFIIFAAVVLYALKQAGGSVDMGGEKHSVETESHAASAAASPASAASK